MKRKYSVELSNLGQFVDCYMALGLIADFFHLAIEESDIAQAIVDVGKWIRHVHLGDSNRLAPGYDHTDRKSCLRALKVIDFNGYMNL